MNEFDTSNVLRSVFSNSLESLIYQYNYLSLLAPNQREQIVIDSNQRWLEVEKQIASNQTINALKILHQFQWASRLGFRINYIETIECGQYCTPSTQEYNDRRYHAEKLFKYCHPKLSFLHSTYLHPIKEFVNTIRSEQEYFDVIWPFIRVPRFSEQVELACNELYNIQLPRDLNITLTDWLTKELREEKWDRHYKEEINKWEKSWFKNRAKLEDIKKRWQLQKNEIERFGVYMSTFFTSLHSSVTWLENLKQEDRDIFLSNCYIKKAAFALNEGTKLKHLLMEEGFSHATIANAIIR
jgi:hypothetical protein